MPDKVEPKFASERFSCPHCGAYAHQSWYRLGMFQIEDDSKPDIFEYSEDLDQVVKTIKDADHRRRAVAFSERLKNNILTYAFDDYCRTDWMIN